MNSLNTALALHDQKCEASMTRLAEAQERMTLAVERIGDATISIRALTDQMRANGKSGGSLPMDKRTMSVAAGILLISAVAAGGGAELVRTLIAVLKH